MPDNALMIEAVIFDLDGLMIQSEALAHRIWLELLEEYGESITADEYQHMIGRAPLASADWILKLKRLPLKRETLLGLYWSKRTEAVIREIDLEPGVMDLLKDIQAIGLPQAVASNSPLTYVEKVLESLGVLSYFSVVRSSDHVNHGKPAPDIYLNTAQGLDVAPSACLAIEDSPVGLKAALQAGMRCVVVPNESLLDQDFSEAYAQLSSVRKLRDQFKDLLV